MKKFWDFLNGNKTAFGGMILTLALLLNQAVNHFEITNEAFMTFIDVLEWLGGWLGGIGVAHKLKKKEVVVIRDKDKLGG